MAPTIPQAKITGLAQAIAKAEGFGGTEPDGTPNLPTRCNNPGDLERGDLFDMGTIDGKTIYPTVAQGWDALEYECLLMLSGKSKVYSPNDTFEAVAVKYTGNDGPDTWAAAVAGALGLTPSNRLTDYIAS